MSDGTLTAAEPVERKGRGWLWWLLPCVLLLAAAGVGAAWYAGLIGASVTDEGGLAVPAEKPPLYHTLDESLVVNFRTPGRARYLQVGIELMTRDRSALETLKNHNPVIRNNLIMLFSDKSFEELSSREGKENLQREALAEVQRVMQLHHGSPAVESLYFTGFLMQ